MKRYYISVVLSEDELSELDTFSQGTPVAQKIADHATELLPLHTKYKTVVFDLDGTILELTDKYPQFGAVKKGFKEIYDLLKKEGFTLGILTARSNVKAQEVLTYLAKKGLKMDFAQENPKEKDRGSNKPKADIYLDDRGFFFSGDWEKDLDVLKELVKSL